MRKTKSLNDIPVLFDKCSYHGESKVSKTFKLSSENVSFSPFSREPFENSDGRRGSTSSREIVLKLEDQRESYVSDSSTEKEDINERKTLKDSKVSKVNVEEKIRDNSKIDALDGPSKKRKRILLVIDVFLSFTLIAPMTIGFWRGTWTLMDIYVNIFPGWLTFVLGFLIHTGFAASKNFLHTFAIGVAKRNTCSSKVVCKCVQIFYTYVFGIACNMYWRGSWILFDHLFNYQLWPILGGTVMATITLAISRSLRNLIAIPLVIAVDKLIFVFRFPTRYKLDGGSRDGTLASSQASCPLAPEGCHEERKKEKEKKITGQGERIVVIQA
ncbi:PREDICTED: uncharacterized protein LOC108555008 [Eufriesea mexicana]|uniref:uncharacterized protein LOC108555008 n=1 Tax=Eufriesea mexicana TaxID=516756 RepID=UPI00083C02AE|nr:PREDICTED: uncharacterized protein LOC108555008 [Eufriesea mexicana]